MLISLPLRLAAHVLDFGYLVDAASGEPQRHLGRGTLRVSAHFPESCTAHALPGRLAAHVSELRLALESDPKCQRALLILPSYEDRDSELAGAHVTLQRVLLRPELELVERPGDSARTSAMVFDWKSFSRHAATIVADADRLLDAKPISVDLPPVRRLQIVRPTVELRARPQRCIGELSSAARSILMGILHGDCVRLGADDCCDEAAFLSVLADVLEVLPEPLRGHASAAAGLTLPDAAVQVAWAGCLVSNAVEASGDRLFGRMDPKTPLAEAGLSLFGSRHETSFRPFEISADTRYAEALISTRTNAGVMPQVRRFVSDLAASHGALITGSPDQQLDRVGAAQAITDLMADGAAAARRQLLVRFVVRTSPQERMALVRECRRHGNPAISTVAQLLCGEAGQAIDLSGLDAALLLAEDAQALRETKSFGASLALRIRGELASFMRSKLLFTEPMLRALTKSDALSAMAAAVIAEADRFVAARLLHSAAVVELLGPKGRALSSAVRQRLTPRDGRVNGFDGKDASDVGDRSRALSALISAELIDIGNVAQSASALASRLISDGRRDLVIDAIRGISNQLDLSRIPDTPADIAVEQRRLDVLVSLAKALRAPPDAIHYVSDQARQKTRMRPIHSR